MKRSKKKDIIVYCVHLTRKFQMCDFEIGDSDKLLGIYFKKEAAIHDLISMVNDLCSANIPQDNEKHLKEYLSEHAKTSLENGFDGMTWRIDETVVSDKERSLNN